MAIAEADWQQLDQALDELLDLEPNQREARLEQIHSANPDQAKTLRRLLDSLNTSDGIESLSESTLFTEALVSAVDLEPGRLIGDWTIIERIGAGGMAEVYLAERELGEVRQQAALKIMALGVGGDHALQRFKQETAILAKLEDPRLSRLIDAGQLADGRPWLAMEYVDGDPIDQVCDDQRLGLRERAALVIQIAHALDHAHRLLVLHRDLKPANILVDRAGRPRVLDFGIAKLMDPLDADSERTATIWRAYTLRYASPEQLSGDPTGVASDVYQLGLLLHLLLTGERAYVGQDDQPLQLLKAIAEGPALPSSLLAATGPQVCAARKSSAKRLRQQAAGDLDSIVMRAIAARPADRYPGARELADDLQRWLDGTAVRARSSSTLYRARRWLWRYRVPVGAATLLVVMLSGYALVAKAQRDQLELERNRTLSVLDSMTKMFSVADPFAEGADTVTVGQVVRSTADQLLAADIDDPQVQALLMDRLATLSDSAHDYGRQIRLLEGAHKLVVDHQLGSDWAASLLLGTAQAQAGAGLFPEATQSLRMALPGLRGEDRYAGQLLDAQLLGESGDNDGATAALRTLLAELPQRDEHAARRANAHNSIALLLGARGDLAAAAEHYQLALSTAPANEPADQDLIGLIRSNLAVNLTRQHHYAAAEKEFRAVLDWRIEKLGADHPSVANSASIFSPLLIRTHRFNSAWELLNTYRGDAARYQNNGRRPDQLTNMARAGIYSGNETASVEAAFAAVEAVRAGVPDAHPRMRKMTDYLAWWLFELGAEQQALQLALKVAPEPSDKLRSRLILLLHQPTALGASHEQAMRDAIVTEPCVSVELAALELAFSGQRDLAHLQLPARCESLRAARLQQLGVAWEPDWGVEIEAEPYSSPLARRLLGESEEAFVMHPQWTAALNRILGPRPADDG